MEGVMIKHTMAHINPFVLLLVISCCQIRTSLVIFVFLLCPVIQRWLFAKFVESYYKWALPMEKHGMVPDEDFMEAMCSCSVMKLPDKFYDKVEEGSIVLKKSKRFSFCKEGLVVEGDSSSETIKSDVVIFATGFNGDQKIREMFKSPLFREIVAGPPSSIVPHFRSINLSLHSSSECIRRSINMSLHSSSECIYMQCDYGN